MKQQGIYYQKDDPGQSLSMIFLNVTQAFTNVSEVGNQINELWKIYGDLRNGQLNDEMISGQPTSETFTFLIGYGRSMFNSIKKESLVPNMFRVTDDLPDFNEPKINLSTRIWDGSGLFYPDGVNTNRANAAIVYSNLYPILNQTQKERYSKRGNFFLSMIIRHY